MARQRSADEIRASIDANRQQLGTSLVTLRNEVNELTDWRRAVRNNQEKLTAAAAGAGFVLAGGIAGLGGVLFGRRRKRH